MSELQEIQSVLKKAGRRWRTARGLRGMWQGLLFGAMASLLALGVFKCFPAPEWMLYLAVLCPLAGMVFGLVLGVWRAPSIATTARWVDSRRQLKERLSTAVEVAGRGEDDKWRELVLKDAVEHVRQLDAKTLLPFGLSKAARWGLAVLVAVAALGFIPEYRSKAYVQKKTDLNNIRQVGRQLADLTRRNLEKRPPILEPTQKALESATATGEQLAKASLTRAEALKELGNVAEKLKDQLKEMGEQPALQRLEQALRSGGGNDSQSLAEIQNQMDALQKQIGNSGASPEAMEKLQKQLEKLQSVARAMTANNAAPSEAERQNMSAALSALSREMEDVGLSLPALKEAIQALAANNTELFLKDLNTAVTDLEKMRQMAKNLQDLQNQVEKMGKDLAEQLQNGQPEAAQATLQKMIQQLNSPNLTPQQLQKIMQEVAKAVNPAGHYGTVGQHLKRAAQQMRDGNKAAASQDLASAAKELEKLVDQLGDAQSLLAELQALNQASMFIANGQMWGACKIPGYKKGGEVGSGVGTWAENENAPWNGQFNDRWDNSGIVREDMDARGISNRDPNLNPALSPTKVKGQFSPGSQMPSITLKNVSIKGQSSVEYESAAAAAQSDAQSAISQEKVPRAYQNAVKDYFDDLKK